ncbi:hypothetical protein D9757_010646 [Collybiopsis confluens]|uniref:Cytochrome P450 n=1 Tax=Collybiopsis confluens TaxID=2823264 RepID=A0A8H5LRR1_9AGAR|nr:hypothetical protein D9757_010646 [Collybiopsis confluens]
MHLLTERIYNIIQVQQEEELDHLDMAILCSAFMIGGVETTASIMQWFTALIPSYPEIQKKAQDELDQVVGRNRLPGVEDEKNLPYIHAIIKEVERCHNPFWLGTPHVNTQDFIYQGQLIPKDTVLVLNTYTMHHDAQRHPEPFRFNPERYMNDSTLSSESANLANPMERDHWMFGVGRRICPGILTLLPAHFSTVISRLLWAFNMERIPDEPIDLKEYDGLSGRSPVPFRIKMIPRDDKYKIRNQTREPQDKMFTLRPLARLPVALARPARLHSPTSIASLSTFANSLNHPSSKSLINFQHLPRSIIVRTAASTVSNRPASQTFDHAALNIKEEASNSAADVAKTIAGGSHPAAEHSFRGITSTLAATVPRPVLIFGLLGAVPYVGAGATTVYFASVAGSAAAGNPTSIDPGVALTLLDQALNVQVTYGAVMLSFLGALHWGMEFAKPRPAQSESIKRLMLGAAPIFFAWPTLALQPMAALVVQWVGFTGLWWADAKVCGMGWTPAWYSQYRFYLSILVGTCIIGSLAGTSYYGPVAGHGFLSHDLELTRDMRKQLKSEQKGVVSGPVEALEGDDAANAYITLKKRDLTKEVEEREKNKGKN